jgi:hypothetical protein
MIQSRVYAVQGDSAAAFTTLKTGLEKLGLSLPVITYADADEHFRKTCHLLESVSEQQLLGREFLVDPQLDAIGPLLVELTSAAYWTDSLLFYQVTMLMLDVSIRRGEYRQACMGYLHFATIAIGRFGMTSFGCKISDLSRRMSERYSDEAYTFGRGETLRPLFVGHLQTPMIVRMAALQCLC